MSEIAGLNIRVDSSEAKKAAADLDKLTSAGAKAEKQADELSKSGKNAAGGLDSVSKSGKKTKDKLDDVSEASKRAGKGMDSLSRQAVDLSKKLAAAFAIYQVVQLAKDVAMVGAQFEKTMATVRGVFGKKITGDNVFKQLNDAAKEMGRTTEFSASQSAEALNFIAMAGFEVKEAIGALPGVIDLATAGNLGLAQATDIATDSLSAFSLKSKDLSDFNDVLIGTITRANTDIQKLGMSFKYVAPIAAQLGYTVRDAGAMLGILANSGIKAETAGTSMSQALIKNVEVAKSFGTAGNDLIGTLAKLKESGAGVTEVTKLYGLESAKSILILMRNIDAYKTLRGELDNVDGESKKLADTMRDTVSGALMGMQSAIEGVKIAAFEKESIDLKDTIIDFTSAIRDNQDAIADGLGAIISTSVKAGTVIVELTSNFTNFYKALGLMSVGAIKSFDELYEFENRTAASTALKALNAARVEVEKWEQRVGSNNNNKQQQIAAFHEREKAIAKLTIAEREYGRIISEATKTGIVDEYEAQAAALEKIANKKKNAKIDDEIAKIAMSEKARKEYDKYLKKSDEDMRKARIRGAEVEAANERERLDVIKARIADEEKLRNDAFDANRERARILKKEYLDVMDSIKSASTPIIRTFLDDFGEGFEQLKYTIIDTLKDAFAKELYKGFFEGLAKQAVGAFGITSGSGVTGGLMDQQLNIPLPQFMAPAQDPNFVGPPAPNSLSISGSTLMAGAAFGMAAISAFKSEDQGKRLGLAAGTAIGAALFPVLGPAGVAMGASIGSQFSLELKKPDFMKMLIGGGVLTMFGQASKTKDIDAYAGFGSKGVTGVRFAEGELQTRTSKKFNYETGIKDAEGQLGDYLNLSVIEYVDGMFQSVEDVFGVSVNNVLASDSTTKHINNLEAMLKDSGSIEDVAATFTAEFLTKYADALADNLSKSGKLDMLTDEKASQLLEKVRLGGGGEVLVELEKLGDLMDRVAELGMTDLSKSLSQVNEDFNALALAAVGLNEEQKILIEQGRIRAKQAAIMGSSPFSVPDVNSVLKEMGGKGIKGGFTVDDERANAYLIFLEKFNKAMAAGLIEDAEKIKLAYKYFDNELTKGTDTAVDAIKEAANRWDTAASSYWDSFGRLVDAQAEARGKLDSAIESIKKDDTTEESIRQKWGALIQGVIKAAVDINSVALDPMSAYTANITGQTIKPYDPMNDPVLQTAIKDGWAGMDTELANFWKTLETEVPDAIKNALELVATKDMGGFEKAQHDLTKSYLDQYDAMEEVNKTKANELILIEAYTIEWHKLIAAQKKATEAALQSANDIISEQGMSATDIFIRDTVRKYEGQFAAMDISDQTPENQKILLAAANIELEKFVEGLRKSNESILEPFKSIVSKSTMSDFESAKSDIVKQGLDAWYALTDEARKIPENADIIIAGSNLKIKELTDAMEKNLTDFMAPFETNVVKIGMSELEKSEYDLIDAYKKSWIELERLGGSAAQFATMGLAWVEDMRKLRTEASLLKVQEAIGAERADITNAYNQHVKSLEKMKKAEEDLLKLREESLAKAEGALDRAFGAERERIEKAYTENLETTNKQIEKLKDSTGDLQSAFDSISNARKSMMISGGEQADYLRTLNQLGRVLSSARGGEFGGLEDFTGKLGALTQDTSKFYANSFEYRRDFGKSVVQLKALEDLTGEQLTSDEETVRLLETRNENAKLELDRQLEELEKLRTDTLGIDTSVIALHEAISQYQIAKELVDSSILANLNEQLTSAASMHEIEMERLNSQLSKFTDIDRSIQSVAQAISNYNQIATDNAAAIASFVPPIEKVSAGSGLGAYSPFKMAQSIVNGIPQYAAGGYHEGGWGMFGEQGPELAFTQPTQVFSNSESKKMMDNSGTVAELKALRAEIRANRSDTKRFENLLLRYAELLEKWEQNDAPLQRAA